MSARCALAVFGAAVAGCAALVLPLPLLHVRPADLGAPRTLEQRLKVTRHGRSVVLDAVVEVSPARVQLIATTLGIRLYAVDYDGQRVTTGQSGAAPGALPPVVVIDDFLLLYAATDVLNAALPRGLRLVASADGRRLYRAERLLIAVEYESADPATGRSRLHNAALDYDLVVDSTVLP